MKHTEGVVQAVAYYRTRDYTSAVKYVNNLIACVAVAGGDSTKDVKWDARDEVLDLFGCYCQSTEEEAARARAAQVLGLSDEQAASIISAADSGELNTSMVGSVSKGPTAQQPTSIF
jgi:hypothetical protein